jgi:hypothetical protein
MISNAGETVPCLYFMNIGLTVFSAKKAPFLNFKMLVPFVVAPSAKIRNGENFPVCSMTSYLSLMAPNARAFFSSEPPLGMKIESMVLQRVPSNGTFSNSALGANAGLTFLMRTTASSQLQWFETMVDALNGAFVVVL